jgi:hypothetical protein
VVVTRQIERKKFFEKWVRVQSPKYQHRQQHCGEEDFGNQVSPWTNVNAWEESHRALYPAKVPIRLRSRENRHRIKWPIDPDGVDLYQAIQAGKRQRASANCGSVTWSAVHAKQLAALRQIAAVQRNDGELLCDVVGHSSHLRDGEFIGETWHVAYARLHCQHRLARIMLRLQRWPGEGNYGIYALTSFAMAFRTMLQKDQLSIRRRILSSLRKCSF